MEEEVCTCCTVKLVLQPILENAISYGVSAMDESGEIRIMGRKEEGKVILTVEDNGIGMSQEEMEFVLTDSTRVPKRGSGVGLVNVNNRIQLLFGKEYGLKIESEPDEGTAVSIIIPAVPYTEENRRSWRKAISSAKMCSRRLKKQVWKMKNSKKVFILTEGILGFLVLLLAVTMLLDKNGKEPYRVSVIIENSEDNQWAAFRYGLRMAARDRLTEVSVVPTEGIMTLEEEKELIKQEIYNGADGLILQPVPGSDTEEMLKK